MGIACSNEDNAKYEQIKNRRELNKELQRQQKKEQHELKQKIKESKKNTPF